MSYTYGLILRPAMIGTVPDNFIVNPINENEEYFRWGTVSYLDPLSDAQIDKYELVCDSPDHVERITQNTLDAFNESMAGYDPASFSQEDLRDCVMCSIPHGKWSKKVHPKHIDSIIDKVLAKFFVTNIK